MPTHKELSNFTYGQLSDMELTNADLEKLSLEELMKIAKSKADALEETPRNREIITALKKYVFTVVAQVSASILKDAIVNTDWKQIMIDLIRLISSFGE